jgi:hypothetical protein
LDGSDWLPITSIIFNQTQKTDINHLFNHPLLVF